MAAARLIDVDDDNLSIPDDRDFDQESLSELELHDLSQTSGYTEGAFAQSSRAAQVAKALEIAEERSLPPSAPGSPLPWDHTAVSSGAGEASSVAPDSNAAPPCYTAAIASDGAQRAAESSWTETMPQSMSDTGLLSQDRVERGDIYGSPERDLVKELRVVAGQLWRIFTEYVRTVQKTRGRKLGLTKRAIRFIAAALVVVIVLSVSLPFIIPAIIRHQEYLEWERESHPFRDQPAYKRDNHKDHPSTEQCKFDVFSKHEEYTGDTGYSWGYRYREEHEGEPINFNLFDEIDTGLAAEFTEPQISGTVEIISIPYRNPWSTPEITVRSNVATNKPWQIEEYEIAVGMNTFKLRSPRLRKGSTSQPGATERSCLSVWVGVYVPVGFEVGNWTTLLRSLSFADHRNYVFNPDEGIPDAQQVTSGPIKVGNSTVIKSNQGSIELSYWNSPKTTLETRRGAIRGRYTFYDSLSVKTLGGTVDIEVDPLGGAMSRDGSHPLHLTTSTGSGNTNVTVLHPSAQDWTPHFMESTHRTTSGSMQLQYPSAWEGTIDGVSMSNHAEVKGRDVQRNDKALAAPGEIHMIKGRASDWAGTLGRIDLESETGSIDLVIGKV
ncbi:hypothetical protein BDY17DRAFT_289067 [Neohortaea acidophila]|uniref:Uncharacterized protein n=1 Tax=Neohortaea acidophila TaxID=245834 RepID=A0A6A6Q537_9PEZI|nr:uncharacterized protein BDY17DRAFT_289067 [Neohortaea acidophila]KAF2487490.1 hypothetical protein BDY17DRAFT_289067 [Neohortaea acidophila]